MTVVLPECTCFAGYFSFWRWIFLFRLIRDAGRDAWIANATVLGKAGTAALSLRLTLQVSLGGSDRRASLATKVGPVCRRGLIGKGTGGARSGAHSGREVPGESGVLAGVSQES